MCLCSVLPAKTFGLFAASKCKQTPGAIPHFATPFVSHISSSIVTLFHPCNGSQHSPCGSNRLPAFPITSTINSLALVSMFGMHSKIACGVEFASSTINNMRSVCRPLIRSSAPANSPLSTAKAQMECFISRFRSSPGFCDSPQMIFCESIMCPHLNFSPSG